MRDTHAQAKTNIATTRPPTHRDAFDFSSPSTLIKMSEAFELSQSNLVNYRDIMLVNDDVGEKEPAQFHFDWSKSLLHGVKNEAYEAFRESAKTQYILRSYLLYACTFPAPERDYIVLIKKNTRLAQAKLKETEDEYLTNPVISQNLVAIRERSAEVFSVDVRDGKGNIINVRIEAYGKGSSVRGLANRDRRPKIVIIDDPQDAEDILSPTVQNNDWNWFLSDIMFLGQSTRIFMIGNNLGDGCILERIAADPEAVNFDFIRLPIIVGDKPTWASKYTKEMIEKEKASYQRLGKIDIWLRERMCVAIADETRMFTRDDFQYFNPRVAEDMLMKTNHFITVDPASSLVDTADFRAIVVNLVTADNLWYVVECAYGRWDTITFFDELFRLSQKWDVREVGFEEGVYKQVVKPFLDADMRRRNQFFTVIPVKAGRTKKEERIKLMQPRFKSKSVLFPQEAHWLAEMEAELLAFTMSGTRGLHDDLIDALAYMEQIVRIPYSMSSHNKNLPRQQESDGALM